MKFFITTFLIFMALVFFLIFRDLLASDPFLFFTIFVIIFSVFSAAGFGFYLFTKEYVIAYKDNPDIDIIPVKLIKNERVFVLNNQKIFIDEVDNAREFLTNPGYKAYPMLNVFLVYHKVLDKSLLLYGQGSNINTYREPMFEKPYIKKTAANIFSNLETSLTEVCMSPPPNKLITALYIDFITGMVSLGSAAYILLKLPLWPIVSIDDICLLLLFILALCYGLFVMRRFWVAFQSNN